MSSKKDKLKIYKPDTATDREIPVAGSGVHAGFPSPAEDHIEGRLDLNKLAVTHPDATFFARVEGDSMKDDCIEDGDLLVIDKSLKPEDGNVVVSYLDGEFTLKRIQIKKGKIYLVPANEKYKVLEVSDDTDFRVWGVVRYVLKKV